MARPAPRSRRRSILALSLVATGVVGFFAWPDRDPLPEGPHGQNVHRAAVRAPDAATGPERRGERVLDSAAAAETGSEQNEYDPSQLVLVVVDSKDRPVPYARVTVDSARGGSDQAILEFGQVSSEGTMWLPAQVRPDALADWRAFVALPGGGGLRPLRPSTPGFVTANAGDVGSLRVVCDGADGRVTIGVFELRDGVPGVGTNVMCAGGAGELRVAAGGLQYQVSAWVARRHATALVTGPRMQGDVVDVRLDVRGCRVVGRFVGHDDGPPIRAHLRSRNTAASYDVEVADDGAFAVTLPRGPADLLVFLRGAECATCPPIVLDADERAVGSLAFEPRPCLGSLEVRDPAGIVLLENPAIDSFTTDSGQQIQGWLGSGLFHVRATLNVGLEYFAVPGVVAVSVAPRTKDAYADPRTIVIRDGRACRVSLRTGGRAVVSSSCPPGTVRYVWLEDAVTARRFDSRNWSPDPATGTSRHEFIGLPPGRYRACADSADVSGGVFEVLDGGEQEIAVSIRPR